VVVLCETARRYFCSAKRRWLIFVLRRFRSEWACGPALPVSVLLELRMLRQENAKLRQENAVMRKQQAEQRTLLVKMLRGIDFAEDDSE
jgi:hypothetical protein